MPWIKRFIVFLILTFIIFFGYIGIGSDSLAHLEKEIITKTDIKVVSVGQYEFGKGGLVLVGIDKNGNGALKAYSVIPGFNSFMKTQNFSFDNQHTSVEWVGESWIGYQALTYQDGKLYEESEGSGLGFGRRVLRWFVLSAFVSCLITYGPAILRNIRNRKKSK